MRELQVGDIVRVIDRSSLYANQRRFIGRELAIVEMNGWEQFILEGAPPYFIEQELEPVFNQCFCNPSREFKGSCFECMEKIYP